MAETSFAPVDVSVVIPCYNQGTFVRAAIESVLTAATVSVEVIVIDDGSTDDQTRSCLEELQWPSTRVLTQTNRGLAAARNAGIRAATGRYLCALDADDLVMPGYFDKAAAMLDAHPDLIFVSPWLEAFGEEKWTWRPERCDLPALLHDCTVCTAALVRLSAVTGVGGYDEAMPHQGYEDWDLWIRLVAAGGRGVILPEALFRYRRYAGSMSTRCNVGEQHLALMEYLHRKHRDLYEQYVFEVFRQQDVEAARLLRENDRIERQTAAARQAIARKATERDAVRRAMREVQLSEQIASALASINRLEHGLASADATRRQLEERLEASMADAHTLRHSMSWRVTAPLRAAYSLLTGAPRVKP